MNLQDIATLLAHAKQIDNREVNEAMIIEWHATLEPVTPEIILDDAREGLRAFRRDSSGWVTPEIVIEYSKRVRIARRAVRLRALQSQVRSLRSADEQERGGLNSNYLGPLADAWDDPATFADALERYNQLNAEWFRLPALTLTAGATDALVLTAHNPDAWMNR